MTWQAWWYAAAFTLMFAAWLMAMRALRRSTDQRRALARENHRLRIDLLRRGFDEQDAALGAQLRPALARGARAAAAMAKAQDEVLETMRTGPNPGAAENLQRLRESVERHPAQLRARLGACVRDPEEQDRCGVHGGLMVHGSDSCMYATFWISGARAAGADL